MLSYDGFTVSLFLTYNHTVWCCKHTQEVALVTQTLDAIPTNTGSRAQLGSSEPVALRSAVPSRRMPQPAIELIRTYMYIQAQTFESRIPLLLRQTKLMLCDVTVALNEANVSS